MHNLDSREPDCAASVVVQERDSQQRKVSVGRRCDGTSGSRGFLNLAGCHARLRPASDRLWRWNMAGSMPRRQSAPVSARVADCTSTKHHESVWSRLQKAGAASRPPRGTTRARPLIPDVRRPINRSDAHFRSGGSCGECGSSTLIRQLNRRRGQGSREPSRLPHPIEAQVARCCGPSLGGWEEARRSLLQTSSIGDPGLALWLPLRAAGCAPWSDGRKWPVPAFSRPGRGDRSHARPAPRQRPKWGELWLSRPVPALWTTSLAMNDRA